VNSRILLLTALPASTCAALPAFFSREGIYTRVAEAFEAGWGATSPVNHALAAAWRLGGIHASEALLFLLTFLPWMLLFAIIGLATHRLHRGNASRIRLAALIGALALGALGLRETAHAIRTDVRTPELAGPVLLATEATSLDGHVLLDRRTRAFALMFGHQVSNEPVSPETLQSPLAWRTAHRESPFSAVALAYPFDSSRQLFETLSASPDWTLAKIDNQGVLFRNAASSTEIPSAQTARTLFDSPREQAFWLAQSALVLQSTGQNSPATALMEEALKLAPADSAVLTKAASLSSAHGKWRRAKSEAEQATARDSRSISARYLLALACMKTGSLDRALDESATLVRLAPSDAASHLLRARIAEASNDPTTEADALERLLDIAQTQNQPTEGIRILLGQAWARAGFPEQALQNNRAALAGELTPRQRKLIEDSIELIERRARPAR